jgi:hypothetical protein
MMKVSELIEVLQKLPQGAEIRIESSDAEYPPAEIRHVGLYPPDPTKGYVIDVDVTGTVSLMGRMYVMSASATYLVVRKASRWNRLCDCVRHAWRDLRWFLRRAWWDTVDFIEEAYQ